MSSTEQRVRAPALRDILTTKWLWSYVGAILVYVVISLVSSNRWGL